MGMTGVASITAICFFLSEALKKIPKFDRKWLPLICAGLGLGLGIVGFYFIPDFPANNIFEGIGVGIISGFAATGVHQAGKQVIKQKPPVVDNPAEVFTGKNSEEGK